MSEILVVGSLAYDSIETPAGRVERALGGSANYFSLAASLYAPVRVVGVVGDDYAVSDEQILVARKVDLSGLERVSGKTFHWEGRYMNDMNEAETMLTELNVFEHFNPKLPENYRDSSFVFLANIAPELQGQVLDQVKAPLFVGMDTMNFWIMSKREALLQTLSRVNVVLINETEAKMLTGAKNGIAAAPLITEMGPQAVVIKRGEYGFAMYTREEGFFILPAMPIPQVIDPTGAGDTFAGGFFGTLATLNRVPTVADMRRACINGTLLASFTIQDFSVKSLAKVTEGEIAARYEKYLKVIQS